MLGSKAFSHWERANEIWRFGHPDVCAIHSDIGSVRVGFSEFQYVYESRTGPLRIANRPTLPLNTGNTRPEESTAVPSAFKNGRTGVLRQFLQVGYDSGVSKSSGRSLCNSIGRFPGISMGSSALTREGAASSEPST